MGVVKGTVNTIENTFLFIAKNILYVALSIGVPIYYLWTNFDIYGTFNAVTKIKLGGVIIVMIVAFFGKSYVASFVYSFPITGWLGIVKRLFWRLSRVLPFIGVYLLIYFTMEYGQLALDVVGRTIITNIFAFVFAPKNIVTKKNVTG